MIDQNITHTESRESTGRTVHAATGLSLLLTLLVLIPFSPTFPVANLDSSWQYAMNVAVATHLRFGKDIIFTFGPLASAYTGSYHPATDGLMMTISAIFVVALFSGLTYMAAPARRVWLILFPLLASQMFLRDAIFMVLPFLMLCAAERPREHHGTARAVLLLTAVACGLLPLIKGSMTLLVVVCTVLAAHALWSKSKFDAISIIAAEFAATVIAWVASGQQLRDLISFFHAQSPIITGYTNSMSLSGDIMEPIAYIPIAIGLSAALWWTQTGVRWRMTFAISLLLFVCFKTGFVRHDGHAVIAGTALVLAGYTTFLRNTNRTGIAAFALGIFGWVYISSSYLPLTPIDDIGRLRSELSASMIGIKDRISGKQTFQKKFEEANADIRSALPLPALSGTADLYPVYISALFASGTKWSPRPILQSYSAYTPDLLKKNSDHLAGSTAPSVIYFDIAPIDGRYPSMDDSLSWPLLISRYRITSLGAQFMVLNKRSSDIPVAVTHVIDARTVDVGAEVPVPESTEPIWAEIDVAPTFLGRIFSTAFKLPTMSVVLKYRDGSQASYRFIPSVGRAGFLLSPTISNRAEFAALQSDRRADFLNSRDVISVRIFGGSGTRLLWGKQYSLKLYAMQYHPDKDVNEILFNRALPSTPSRVEIGGDCNIDVVNEISEPHEPMHLFGGSLFVRGWAAISAAGGTPNDGVYISLKNTAGARISIEANKTPRPDVGIYFKHPEMTMDGFESVIDTRSLRGAYEMRVMQKKGNTFYECSKATVPLYIE